LLSDVVMPGMDGPALAQQLAGIHPGIFRDTAETLVGEADCFPPAPCWCKSHFRGRPCCASCAMCWIPRMPRTEVRSQLDGASRPLPCEAQCWCLK
jgi:hypothetical protein